MSLGKIQEQFDLARAAWLEAQEEVLGRRVRITSDYNGQPHGHSSKSLRGVVRRIQTIHFDMQEGVSFKLEGYGLFIRMEEVEFI